MAGIISLEARLFSVSRCNKYSFITSSPVALLLFSLTKADHRRSWLMACAHTASAEPNNRHHHNVQTQESFFFQPLFCIEKKKKCFVTLNITKVCTRFFFSLLLAIRLSRYSECERPLIRQPGLAPATSKHGAPLERSESRRVTSRTATDEQLVQKKSIYYTAMKELAAPKAK